MTGTYADQRGHDVAWMTAAEREEYGARLAAVDAAVAAAGLEPDAGQRAEVDAGHELAEIGGVIYNPVVHCAVCGYTSPARWREPLHCPACPKLGNPAAVMGEVLMTSREYSAAVGAFAASLG